MQQRSLEPFEELDEDMMILYISFDGIFDWLELTSNRQLLLDYLTVLNGKTLDISVGVPLGVAKATGKSRRGAEHLDGGTRAKEQRISCECSNCVHPVRVAQSTTRVPPSVSMANRS